MVRIRGKDDAAVERLGRGSRGLSQRTKLVNKKQPEECVLQREWTRRGGGGEFGKGRSGTWATLPPHLFQLLSHTAARYLNVVPFVCASPHARIEGLLDTGNRDRSFYSEDRNIWYTDRREIQCNSIWNFMKIKALKFCTIYSMKNKKIL